MASVDTVLIPQARTRPLAEFGRWARLLGSNFLLQRLIKAVLTIFFVTSLLFFLVRLMPSNPLEVYIAELMSQYSMSYTDARSQAASLFAIDLDAPMWNTPRSSTCCTTLCGQGASARW